MEKAIKAKCDDCPLINNAFVASEVNDSQVLALAEAPGYNEVQQGRPLVGVAGQDMNKIIESIGAKRKEFATFANVVSCRPTKREDGKVKNRTPTEREIACCNERLAYEIDKYNPSVIVVMGKIPYIALGGKVFSGFRMADIVGTEFLYKKYRVIITYHPAAISHSGGEATERGRLIRDTIKSAFEKVLEPKFVASQLESKFVTRQLELF